MLLASMFIWQINPCISCLFPPFFEIQEGTSNNINYSVSSLIDISEFTHYKITIYETKQKNI